MPNVKEFQFTAFWQFQGPSVSRLVPRALSARVSSDKLCINSPTCEKIIWNKRFRYVLFPPTSLETNGTGTRSERNHPPTIPLNSFTYLRAHSRKGVGWGTRNDIKRNEALGSLATLQDLTGLCQPSASLCLSHNKHKLSSLWSGGCTIRWNKPFANANSIVASCQAATQKRMLIFTWTRTDSL